MIRPGSFFRHIARSRNSGKIDRELHQAVSALKNMAIMSREAPVGADTAIEQLAFMSDLAKPAFLKMLAHLRLSQRDEARAEFIKESGTQMSARVADILLFWDCVNPDELENMTASLLESMEQERVTQEMFKDEKHCDLIYIPIFINVLLLCLNFLILTFFQEQKESFGMFFNM